MGVNYIPQLYNTCQNILKLFVAGVLYDSVYHENYKTILYLDQKFKKRKTNAKKGMKSSEKILYREAFHCIIFVLQNRFMANFCEKEKELKNKRKYSDGFYFDLYKKSLFSIKERCA